MGTIAEEQQNNYCTKHSKYNILKILGVLTP